MPIGQMRNIFVFSFTGVLPLQGNAPCYEFQENIVNGFMRHRCNMSVEQEKIKSISLPNRGK